MCSASARNSEAIVVVVSALVCLDREEGLGVTVVASTCVKWVPGET